MSSLMDHGMMRTTEMEQVVAPIACHLCDLVLLCDGPEAPEAFSQLEAAAQLVAKATENMSAVASRRMSETDDEVLRMEMSAMLEPLALSGQHVLLAAQKLSIQPGSTEHKELVTATQNVLLTLVKVLLVDDNATVRTVVSAADRVLERLSELGSCSDIQSLLKVFSGFSDDLLLLHSLTVDRAHCLQDPHQSKQLLGSLDTLQRCVSMLHTAMSTTIKHPSSEEAQAARSFILGTVQSTVEDITDTLRRECPRRSLGPGGFYTDRRKSLLQLLESCSDSSALGSSFDVLVRDLVFHCMVVADASPREFQQGVVLHCRHVLHFWSDVKRLLKEESGALERLRNICAALGREIQQLHETVTTTVLHLVADTFVSQSSVVEELLRATRHVARGDSSAEMDLDFLQPLVEDFISRADELIQVADFISTAAADSKSLESVENSRVCLRRVRDQIAPLSEELADKSMETLRKLHERCLRWEEETGQLQDAVSDVMDVGEFTTVCISQMVSHRRGGDAAYRRRSYRLFREHATKLSGHMKLLTRSARRHLDTSDDPIYRNGLLVLLRQVRSRQGKVDQSVRDMLVGSSLNVEAYSTFSDDASAAIKSFKVLREGLDGQRHPHLLSPLREGARQPQLSDVPAEEDACELNLGLLEIAETDGGSRGETVEAEQTRECDGDDPETAAAAEEPAKNRRTREFDLLPLLCELVSVTKGKDVTELNRSCTRVLELSNCYAQAAKEASAVVDAVDEKMLESFRAELVSLTPLLVQTAQETAMSSAKSAENLYRHGSRFSDLISSIRRVLLPAAGTWFHAVYTELRGNETRRSDASQQLSEVMNSCADVVQLTSDLTTQSDGRETVSALHGKLSKAQNCSRRLLEFRCSQQEQLDQLEALCLLWSLSVHTLLSSLDEMLGTSSARSQLSPQKQLSVLAEGSLRLQEAARLTSLHCKSVHKSRQLTGHQEALRALTDAFLRAAEERGAMPRFLQHAKSELLQKKVLIKMKVLSDQLNKVNDNYNAAVQEIVGRAAELSREEAEDAEERLEPAARSLFEKVTAATRRAEDCLNFVRDSRTRGELRSINDHLPFHMSDILSRVKLLPEADHVWDRFSLDVQIQCWSAKARHLVEEMSRQDGVRQEVVELVRGGLQGGTVLGDVQEVFRTTETANAEHVDAAGPNLGFSALVECGNAEKDDGSALTFTSLFLKHESDRWDPEDNRIVQVTGAMADVIYYMCQYLRNRGPLLSREAFVAAAKDVITRCRSVTQFLRVIADHCLDKQCAAELSVVVEQILTVTNQLSIISSVKAVTPGCKSSDEVLVKNAQNLLQTVLRGVRAAEAACITGLKQPEPNSHGAEATACCFQWKRNLEIHRAQETANPETDDLGLRKTSSHPVAPSLAPPSPPRRGALK